MLYHLFLLIEFQIENYLSGNFPSNVVDQCMYPRRERKERGLCLLPASHNNLQESSEPSSKLHSFVNITYILGFSQKPAPEALFQLKLSWANGRSQFKDSRVNNFNMFFREFSWYSLSPKCNLNMTSVVFNVLQGCFLIL